MELLPRRLQNLVLQGPPFIYKADLGLGEVVINELKNRGDEVLQVDATTGKAMTANEVLEEAVAVAEKLRSMGIGPGDFVGFFCENRLEFAPSSLATLAIGAICAPFNPTYTSDELIHVIGISQPKIIFASGHTSKIIDQVRSKLTFLKRVIVFDEIEASNFFVNYTALLKTSRRVEDFQPTHVDPQMTTAFVLCSSGTTGLPKCVELTHSNSQALLTAKSNPKISGDIGKDVILGLMPFFHGYGLHVLYLALVNRMKIIIMANFQETLFFEVIQNYKIAVLQVVPPILVTLAKSHLVHKFDISSVRTIICGAAPLSKDIIKAVQSRLKHCQIFQAYGMTELSVACVFTPTDRPKTGSTGVIAPGMEFKVINIQTGKNLTPFKEGELCFKGPFIMKGYLNNKKATNETIDKDGWLHTGDLGFYDTEGYIFISGRLKELIKYKGFQVAPAELEAILLNNPSLKDAAVIGIPDEAAGELPFAFIVKQQNAKITAAEVKDYIASNVSPQKYLRGGVRFVNEIPKNRTGKILRRELHKLYKTESKL